VYHPIMKSVALLLVAAVAASLGCGCGGQPALANVPHPNNAAMAGGAAAAAAALTLVDPDAATRKPEKRQEEEKQPVDVKETVPSDVLDRADHPAAGAGSGSAAAKPKKTPSGPPPKLPSPRDAVGDPTFRCCPN